MTARRTLPPPPMMPDEGASPEEIGAALAAFLDWVVRVRLHELLAAGLTHADLFRLLRVADDFRKMTITRDTLATLDDLIPKLGDFRVF